MDTMSFIGPFSAIHINYIQKILAKSHRTTSSTNYRKHISYKANLVFIQSQQKRMLIEIFGHFYNPQDQVKLPKTFMWLWDTLYTCLCSTICSIQCSMSLHSDLVPYSMSLHSDEFSYTIFHLNRQLYIYL
jgi:hypothetical protein